MSTSLVMKCAMYARSVHVPCSISHPSMHAIFRARMLNCFLVTPSRGAREPIYSFTFWYIYSMKYSIIDLCFPFSTKDCQEIRETLNPISYSPATRNIAELQQCWTAEVFPSFHFLFLAAMFL